MKLQLGLWDYESDDRIGIDCYAGSSEFFAVTQGKTVLVDVDLFPGSPDDDDDDIDDVIDD